MYHLDRRRTAPPRSRTLALRSIRTLRLASGLVLASFVVVHLANHSLGIVSVDAQEAMRRVVSPIYRSAPGTVLLYGSFLVHFCLGLYSLWRRTTLRMPRWELAQLVLGLLVPPLVMVHAIGARVGTGIVGIESTYPGVLASLWSKTETLIRQPTLVLVMSAHLGIGLHFWLRLREWYRRWLPAILPLAAMLPVLALLGFLRGGLDVRAGNGAVRAGDDYGYGAPTAPARPAPSPEQRARIDLVETAAYGTYGAALLGVLAARALRRRLRAAGRSYRIHHAGGRTITAPIGQSVLEALREAQIPHASVCGGRARCTTCRLRVGTGVEALPPPEPIETTALKRIGAEPGVRLACQIRPRRDLHVTPLVPADASASTALHHGGVRGRERRIVAMFIDLRESSRLGEERLPYDVIFILNRFFAEMAQALRETNGYYSTFNGDGLLALYGIDSDLRDAARDALRGAHAAMIRLDALNRSLASELKRPLRIGIGLHAGEAVVGTMGPPATPILSAIGDTVNVAARLESEAKELGCTLVVSAACAQAAGIDLSAFPARAARVRGRTGEVAYHPIPDARALAPLLGA